MCIFHHSRKNKVRYFGCALELNIRIIMKTACSQEGSDKAIYNNTSLWVHLHPQKYIIEYIDFSPWLRLKLHIHIYNYKADTPLSNLL